MVRDGGADHPDRRDGQQPPAGLRRRLGDRIDLDSGEVTRLLSDIDGERFLGPNDIVFDRHGGFWFTDFGKTGPRSQDRGAVYYAKADGSGVRRVAQGLLGPNGIGLSPDGATLYVAETYTGRLLAWDVSGPGEVSAGSRIVVSTPNHFDSLAVEADGTVVVAAINHGICAVRPDGTLEYTAMPDAMTTNIAFGGDDLRTAYVTLSAGGRLAALDWPRPGLRLAH